MPVHVSHEKVEDCQVHDVQQPTAFVVRFRFPHDFAVVLVRLPIGFSPFVIRSTPGMAPGFSRNHRL